MTDPYRNALDAAHARIADLERRLEKAQGPGWWERIKARWFKNRVHHGFGAWPKKRNGRTALDPANLRPPPGGSGAVKVNHVRVPTGLTVEQAQDALSIASRIGLDFNPTSQTVNGVPLAVLQSHPMNK